MSWKGVPKKENYMPLFAEDWNLVVDALDDIYNRMAGWSLQGFDFSLLPTKNKYFDLGSPSKMWRYVWAEYIYAEPIWTSFLEALKSYIHELRTLTATIQNLKANRGDFETLYVGGQPIEAVAAGVDPELKAMVSEILMREIAKTETKLVEVITPSGSTELYKPQIGYNVIVRDWYLITNSDTGEIKLIPLLSLSPIAWLPADVLKSAQAEGMWLQLYYDEPVWLYWYNLTPYSKILATLNFYELFLGFSAFYPSGFDPDDPTWAPAEGWTKVWNFLNMDDVKDYAFNDPNNYRYAATLNGIVKFDTPSGDYGLLSHYKDAVTFSRVAITFKITNIDTENYDADALGAYIDDGSVAIGARIIIKPLISDKIYLSDYGSGAEVEIPYNGEWLLFLYDFNERKARIYDKNKQLLAEVMLTNAGTVSVESDAYAYDYNEFYFGTERWGTFRTQIDWIAVQ